MQEDKWVQGLFDFGFEEILPEPKVINFKTFSDPKNGNEKLFNLQKKFFETKDEKLLGEMFMLMLSIAKKLVTIEAGKHKMKVGTQTVDDWATDASIYFIEQIKKNDLVIETSFVAYLRLQVLKAMFYTTKAEQFEKFCVKHHLNLFKLTEQEKQLWKADFEKWI